MFITAILNTGLKINTQYKEVINWYKTTLKSPTFLKQLMPGPHFTHSLCISEYTQT